MSLKKQKIIVVIILALLVSAPHFVSAAGLVPCGNNGQNPCTVTDIFVLVAQVTNWLIAAAGVYAVYKLINAGFYLVISLGNEEAITKWKGSIQDSIIGFVLIMMAFMFVNTIVNVLLTRSLVTNNPKCQLDLTKPLNYLEIDPNNCNGLDEKTLQTVPGHQQ